MDDHKLKVFCAVAETKSFSQASKLMFLTQPAISLQIRALEEQLGTKLFTRSNKAVALTETGEILYRHAQKILSAYAAIEKELNEATGLVKGKLLIGASTTLATYYLPNIIVEFKKSYPDILIDFERGNTQNIVDSLLKAKIDLGLVEGEVKDHRIEVEKMDSDELLLVVNGSHPWAERQDISIQEIIGQPFIMREEGSGTRQVIESALERAGVNLEDLNIVMYLGSTEAIKTAVENGLGISIISGWAIQKEVRFGVLRPLWFQDIRFKRDFSLVYQKKSFRTQPAEKFIELLKRSPMTPAAR
ncbi:MAG: selenium metabolism-associated LysR family transcriptional regulator [bacterium]|nr:selenium metabolism-associated LysR family transcriptional regulator [bacterium]